jgi:integrase
MIGADASLKAVQAILGHRSAAFTLTVYGHLFDADLDQLAARLDLANSSRTSPTNLGERRARDGR